MPKKSATTNDKEPSADNEIKDAKDRLRDEARLIIDSLMQSNLDTRTETAINKLKAIADFKSAKTILLYHPIRGEINLEPLLTKKDKRWVLPRALGKGIMVFFEVPNFDNLLVGKYGIKVPHGSNKFITEQEIDLIIAPGLMFDKKGYRLGRGGGYYDRLLAKTKARTVGLCFKELKIDEIPHEEHDKPVDYVLEI